MTITRSRTNVEIKTVIIPYKIPSKLEKKTCPTKIIVSKTLIAKATEIPVFLLKMIGGTSIPPVLYPNLKTIPNPTPVNIPA